MTKNEDGTAVLTADELQKLEKTARTMETTLTVLVLSRAGFERIHHMRGSEFLLLTANLAGLLSVLGMNPRPSEEVIAEIKWLQTDHAIDQEFDDLFPAL